MTEISGKTAFITGGGTGIGRAIAIDMAEAGVRTIICGRREAPLKAVADEIKDRGKHCEIVLCDLTDPEAIASTGQDLLNRYGTIDILINNAGFSSKIRSARYIGAEEWRDVMDVNTLGPALMTQALLQPMIDQKSGDVVTISSVAALSPSIMAGAVYSAAKAAARNYMHVLAEETRQHGIRCITVFPGEVDTAILDNRALVPDEAERAKMMMPEDISAAVLMAVSLPRRATVNEITIGATEPRDMSADVAAALNKSSL